VRWSAGAVEMTMHVQTESAGGSAESPSDDSRCTAAYITDATPSPRH
jgi:hypothetical protein